MYEVFANLLKERGIKTSDVCKATGISATTFTDWKNGKSRPKTDKLHKIADYFDVTIYYLMTGKTDEEPHASAPESDDIKKEFDRFRKLLKSGDVTPLCYDNTPAGHNEINALLKMLDASEELIRNSVKHGK